MRVHPRNVFVVGSPVCEVYAGMKNKFANSKILETLKLKSREFLSPVFTEENVDKGGSLEIMVETFNALANVNMPIIVSTHPRTRHRLDELNPLGKSDPIIWHEPFGLIDFVRLQKEAVCVIFDSGTIHEDPSILGFPAVAIRKSTEKQDHSRPVIVRLLVCIKKMFSKR